MTKNISNFSGQFPLTVAEARWFSLQSASSVGVSVGVRSEWQLR